MEKPVVIQNEAAHVRIVRRYSVTIQASDDSKISEKISIEVGTVSKSLRRLRSDSEQWNRNNEYGH